MLYVLNRVIICGLCYDSAKTQDLEEEQPSVEAELRRLMEKPGWYNTGKKSEHLPLGLIFRLYNAVAFILFGVTN